MDAKGYEANLKNLLKNLGVKEDHDIIVPMALSFAAQVTSTSLDTVKHIPELHDNLIKEFGYLADKYALQSFDARNAKKDTTFKF